jgi:hypothetical protein
MPGSDAAPSHWTLVGELLLLFVVLPVAFRFKLFPFPPIPALWLLAGYCLYRLFHDSAFDPKLLWNLQALPGIAPQILLTFALAAIAVAAAVYFSLPKCCSTP